MKIIIRAELSKNEIPLDYRRAFVSFIKSSLTDYNIKLYEYLYGENKTKQKKFSFNFIFNNPVFLKEKIHLGNNTITSIVSTNDFGLGIDLYNGFLNSMGKTYPLENNNHVVIKKIRIENHQIFNSNKVVIKFNSPLIVRNHSKDEKDVYYLYSDKEFDVYLNQCIEHQLKNCSMTEIGDYKIKLNPINVKKVIVKSFGINIPGSLGVFELSASPQVINELYQMGAGSRRSQGFGLFEILS